MQLAEINEYISEQWQAIEQKHLSRAQVGIIKDLRQVELLRDYLQTLDGGV